MSANESEDEQDVVRSIRELKPDFTGSMDYENEVLHECPVCESNTAAADRQRCAVVDLLACSDIVSLHVPLTDQTRGLVDRSALSRMKRGAISAA